MLNNRVTPISELTSGFYAATEMNDETPEGAVGLADPDSRVHAAWITQVAKPADALLHEQVPEHGDHGDVRVGTSSLNVPERLPQQVNSQQAHSLVRGGHSAISIVAIALALTAAVIVLQHLGFPIGSREASDHASNNVSSPQGLTAGTDAIGTPQRTAKLLVQSSPAVVGEPAPLGITLGGAANDAVVVLKGLPPGMELSTGHAVADAVWQLSAAALPDAWIAPPVGFVGSAHLLAELQLANSQIIDRQSINLEWTQGGHETGTATNAPAALQHLNDPPLPTARPDTSAKPSGVDPSAPRELSTRARQRGDDDLRRSVNERGRRVPSISDSSRPPRGFWDWSR